MLVRFEVQKELLITSDSKGVLKFWSVNDFVLYGQLNLFPNEIIQSIETTKDGKYLYVISEYHKLVRICLQSIKIYCFQSLKENLEKFISKVTQNLEGGDPILMPISTTKLLVYGRKAPEQKLYDFADISEGSHTINLFTGIEKFYGIKVTEDNKYVFIIDNINQKIFQLKEFVRPCYDYKNKKCLRYINFQHRDSWADMEIYDNNKFLLQSYDSVIVQYNIKRRMFIKKYDMKKFLKKNQTIGSLEINNMKILVTRSIDVRNIDQLIGFENRLVKYGDKIMKISLRNGEIMSSYTFDKFFNTFSSNDETIGPQWDYINEICSVKLSKDDEYIFMGLKTGGLYQIDFSTMKIQKDYSRAHKAAINQIQIA